MTDCHFYLLIHFSFAWIPCCNFAMGVGLFTMLKNLKIIFYLQKIPRLSKRFDMDAGLLPIIFMFADGCKKIALLLGFPVAMTVGRFCIIIWHFQLWRALVIGVWSYSMQEL